MSKSNWIFDTDTANTTDRIKDRRLKTQLDRLRPKVAETSDARIEYYRGTVTIVGNGAEETAGIRLKKYCPENICRGRSKTKIRSNRLPIKIWRNMQNNKNKSEKIYTDSNGHPERHRYGEHPLNAIEDDNGELIAD